MEGSRLDLQAQLDALAGSVSLAGAQAQRKAGELAKRIEALEQEAVPDQAAIATINHITNEGDVINETLILEAEEEEKEEEEELFFTGKSKHKVRRLKKGKPGQVLTVGPGGILEWIEPGGGGGPRTLRGTWPRGPLEAEGVGWKAVFLKTGFVEVTFDEPFPEGEPPRIYLTPYAFQEDPELAVDTLYTSNHINTTEFGFIMVSQLAFGTHALASPAIDFLVIARP